MGDDEAIDKAIRENLGKLGVTSVTWTKPVEEDDELCAPAPTPVAKPSLGVPPLVSSSLELEELTTERHPDLIYKWNTKALHSMFGLDNWEDTQLYGILSELDLLKTPHTIAGGCMVRHLMKTDITKGDIDIWPKDAHSAHLFMREYQAKGYTVERSKYSYFFEHKMGLRKIKVQIMHKNANHMSTVLSKFDFEHVRVGYFGERFLSTLGATTAIAQRKLHLRYVIQPDYSLLRALKYQGMGYDGGKAIQQLAVMINRKESDINAAEWEEKNPIVEY